MLSTIIVPVSLWDDVLPNGNLQGQEVLAGRKSWSWLLRAFTAKLEESHWIMKHYESLSSFGDALHSGSVLGLNKGYLLLNPWASSTPWTSPGGCQRVTELSNLWWMPNSVGMGFDTVTKMGSSRKWERYPTTNMWVSSQLPVTKD